LRAWSFARLTDFYGAIPYTEANRGLEQIFFPTYDNQSSIYPDLLRELEEAAGQFTTNSELDITFPNADIIYQGDVAKWKRFAYSLMLRLAMRVSNVAEATLTDPYVAKAVAGGVFQSNDDNVWLPMAIGPSQWTNQNGISRSFRPGYGGDKNLPSKTMIDFLMCANPNDASDDDPRLRVLSDGPGIWDANGWAPNEQDPVKQREMPSGLFFDNQ